MDVGSAAAARRREPLGRNEQGCASPGARRFLTSEMGSDGVGIYAFPRRCAEELLVCGIAGYVSRHSVFRQVVDAQLDLLTHRGPDSRGVITGTRCIIGQTRLAIIDLETGDPPIANEDGSVGVALNGEIYNYRELRDELGSAGHRLRTKGDTEVICHLAEDHGPVELASKLHGMFAFAVWDERKGRLVLGRDRLGKKPLYYWLGPNEFVFASEIKALLEHPAVPRRLNADAIPGYLTFGYVSTPNTFFEGIFSVPPGQVMTVNQDLRVSAEPYWEPEVPRLGGGHKMPLKVAARAGTESLGDCRRTSADLRCSPRRLPQRRHRLKRDRGRHVRAQLATGQDLHDRVRRSRRIRRASLCPDGGGQVRY